MKAFAAFVVLVLSVPAASFAHPRHVTTTTIDLRPERGVLEVAVKVELDDLKDALTIYEDEPVDFFAKNEKTAAALMRYMSQKLVVQRDGPPWPLRWVGHEVTPKGTWLYFEVLGPKGSWSGASVRNTSFFELEATQMNVVTVRNGKDKRTVSFTRSSNPFPLLPEAS